jgi:hypothetical protein
VSIAPEAPACPFALFVLHQELRQNIDNRPRTFLVLTVRTSLDDHRRSMLATSARLIEKQLISEPRGSHLALTDPPQLAGSNERGFSEPGRWLYLYGNRRYTSKWRRPSIRNYPERPFLGSFRLTIQESIGSINTSAFIRTYPDLTRFPTGRFYVQVNNFQFARDPGVSL